MPFPMKPRPEPVGASRIECPRIDPGTTRSSDLTILERCEKGPVVAFQYVDVDGSDAWTGPPLLLHQAGRLNYHAALRAGTVLVPLRERLTWARGVNIFTEDFLAGDADLLFFAVGLPASSFGGRSLVFDLEETQSFAEQRFGYRMFDLIHVYRDVAFRGIDGWGKQHPVLAPFVKQTGARIGSRLWSLSDLREMVRHPLYKEVRQYAESFANAFTFWADDSRAALELNVKVARGRTSAGFALNEIQAGRDFAHLREKLALLSDTAKVDLGVLYKRFEDHFAVRSRFLGTSVGEVVVAGAVPLCLAHGVATWDLPGGAVVGYQYVPGSLELFTEADYTQAQSALNARALGELPWL